MKVFVTASDGVSGRRLVPALLGAESRGTGMTRSAAQAPALDG